MASSPRGLGTVGTWGQGGAKPLVVSALGQHCHLQCPSVSPAAPTGGWQHPKICSLVNSTIREFWHPPKAPLEPPNFTAWDPPRAPQDSQPRPAPDFWGEISRIWGGWRGTGWAIGRGGAGRGLRVLWSLPSVHLSICLSVQHVRMLGFGVRMGLSPPSTSRSQDFGSEWN